MESYTIEYANEREYKELERAIKKYNIVAYKNLAFEVYPFLSTGNFVGDLISNNKVIGAETYEVVLPSTDEFLENYGEVKLLYSVYIRSKKVVLDRLEPRILLDKSISPDKSTNDKNKVFKERKTNNKESNNKVIKTKKIDVNKFDLNDCINYRDYGKLLKYYGRNIKNDINDIKLDKINRLNISNINYKDYFKTVMYCLYEENRMGLFIDVMTKFNSKLDKEIKIDVDLSKKENIVFDEEKIKNSIEKPKKEVKKVYNDEDIGEFKLNPLFHFLMMIVLPILVLEFLILLFGLPTVVAVILLFCYIGIYGYYLSKYYLEGINRQEREEEFVQEKNDEFIKLADQEYKKNMEEYENKINELISKEKAKYIEIDNYNKRVDQIINEVNIANKEIDEYRRLVYNTLNDYINGIRDRKDFMNKKNVMILGLNLVESQYLDAMSSCKIVEYYETYKANTLDEALDLCSKDDSKSNVYFNKMQHYYEESENLLNFCLITLYNAILKRNKNEIYTALRFIFELIEINKDLYC